MSLTGHSTAKCSKCGCRQELDIFRSINVSDNPELKQKVMDGSLFVWKCQACGAMNLAVHETLYHDKNNKLMVWLYPGGEVPASQLELISKQTAQMKGYCLRIVADVTSLMEKILICEEKLNDMVIEMCKWVTKLELSQNAKEKDADRFLKLPMHFLKTDKEHNALVLGFPLDGQMKSCNIGMNVYEDCLGILQRNPQICQLSSFAKIDEDWIASFMA